MIISALFATIAGGLIGIATGLLPGISMTLVMIMLFAVLVMFDPVSICCFYISCLVVSQYMGSVSSSLLGILGEASSIPAMREGYQMTQHGRGNEALAISAWGSLVGGIIALIMALLLFSWVEYIFAINYVEIKLLFFVLLFGVLIAGSSNQKWITLLQITLGVLLGKVGWNQYTNQTWGTFNIDILSNGIPTVVVLCCFYAIPLLLSVPHVDDGKNSHPQKKYLTINQIWNILPKFSIVRGTIVGFFTGLIPYLTYVAASKFAWALEKKYAGANYQVGHAPSLAAAETANNSGALTSLLPFLVFMVPIQLSEIVLLDIINSTGQSFSPGWITQNSNILYLIMSFGIANIIGFIFSWPLGQHVTTVAFRYKKLVTMIAIVVMLATVIVSGYSIDQSMYYLVLGAIAGLLGWYSRQWDVVPFVTAFLLSKPLELVLIVSMQKFT
jgi:putative tricarboxylic transport membrane protein